MAEQRKPTSDETLLIEMISVISEEYYGAAWLHDIEVMLWEQLSGSREYINNQEQMTELRHLSKRIQCWATWDHGAPRIIPLAEWEHLYAVRQDIRRQTERDLNNLKAIYERYRDDPEFRRAARKFLGDVTKAENN